MNEFSTYEFVVNQRIEGRWLLARIGLVFLYTAYALGLLILGLQTRIIAPLLALIPVTLWIIVFVTWRYTDVEYEYSITSGELTFAKIFGSRSRRRQLVITLRDAVSIAPWDNGEHSKRAADRQPVKE